MNEREIATGLLALKIEAALARDLTGECAGIAHLRRHEELFQAYCHLFGKPSLLEPGGIKPARLVIPGYNA